MLNPFFIAIRLFPLFAVPEMYHLGHLIRKGTLIKRREKACNETQERKKISGHNSKCFTFSTNVVNQPLKNKSCMQETLKLFSSPLKRGKSDQANLMAVIRYKKKTQTLTLNSCNFRIDPQIFFSQSILAIIAFNNN